jgi:hypothetical protein
MTNVVSRLTGRYTTAILFVAGLVVGVMAYTGDLRYTPIVLALLVLAVVLDRIRST